MNVNVPQIVDDLYAGTLDDAAWDRAFIGIADMVDRALILSDAPLPRLCRRLAEHGGEHERLIRIEREPGRWPINVVISAVPDLTVRWITADAAYVLLLFDPERQITPSSQLLAHKLNISAREAEIAVLLAMGLDLLEVAKRLSVSIHTARTHAIFAKTGIRSQAQLVSRVTTDAAAHSSFSSMSESRLRVAQ